jgi:transposase
LKTLFADSGYQGPKFAKALAKVLPHLDIEIVKRSDQVSGFAVLPKRWIVERRAQFVEAGACRGSRGRRREAHEAGRIKSLV